MLKTRHAVDLWIIYKFSLINLIIICFGMTVLKHIFIYKNVIELKKLTETVAVLGVQ